MALTKEQRKRLLLSFMESDAKAEFHLIRDYITQTDKFLVRKISRLDLVKEFGMSFETFTDARLTSNYYKLNRMPNILRYNTFVSIASILEFILQILAKDYEGKKRSTTIKKKDESQITVHHKQIAALGFNLDRLRQDQSTLVKFFKLRNRIVHYQGELTGKVNETKFINSISGLESDGVRLVFKTKAPIIKFSKLAEKYLLNLIKIMNAGKPSIRLKVSLGSSTK